jgi:WD40 repeat protein
LALRTRQYEAFISYSHASDSILAAELQRILNRIARPTYKWWQRWPPRVFRDQTNLAAASDLGAEIENALASSDSFVLLASTQGAASPWVDREVRTWCANKPSDRLFIALTSGALAWDDAHGDFDRTQTNAIPPALMRVFETEPLWVDFTGVREDESLSRDPRFVDGAATLAAAIRRTDKDALVGEDVRQRRRTKQLVVGAIGLLTLLTAVAGLAAIYAFIQRNHAEQRARLATSRQLAAEAVVALDNDPEQSLVLAARAASTALTTEAENALRQALRNSSLRSLIDARAPVLSVSLDPTGRLVAAGLGNGSIRTWALRTGNPVATRRLASVPVESVQFSRDGGRLLGAGLAGVAVWSTSKGSREPLAVFDRKGGPFAAAFSPNRKLVATGDFDGIVRLWRTDSGVQEDELPTGELAPVTTVSFSANGLRLAAASGSQAVVWTLPVKRRQILRSHGNQVWAVGVSPDGTRVATGDISGLVRVWNLRTGAVGELNGHSGAITSLAFSPDGRLLVTASQDETGRIWDVGSGRPLAELRGHHGIVKSAAFAPDGQTVVTGGRDGSIRIWSAMSDPVRVDLGGVDDRTLHDVQFDPSGERLVTASEDLTARVWDVPRRRVVRVLRHGHRRDEWVESAQFSHDGRLIVTAGDDGTAKVWKASSGALLATLGQSGATPLYDAALSPDGRTLAASGQAAAGGGPVVRAWRWRQRTLVMEHRGLERADGVAFSPAGTLLGVAGHDEVRVWRVGAETAPAAVLRGRGELMSVAFDPGGDLVAAGSSNGSAWVWDLRSKLRIASIVAHSDPVTGVGFSGDGRYLVTAGLDGVAKVWTVPEGDLVTVLRPRANALESAAFGPRGRSVAVAGSGGHVTVFDCAECRPVRSLVCLAAIRVTPRVRARHEDAFRRCH